MTNANHISQEDLAMHALNALDPEESATVRAHLAACAECRTAWQQFAGDAAMVGLTSQQKMVPDGARQRFLDRIAADAQAAAKTPGAPRVVEVMPIRRSAWVPWAIAAALAVVAVGLGFQSYRLNTQLQQQTAHIAELSRQSAQAERVAQLLSSRSAQHVLLTASKTEMVPSGRAIYLAQSGSLLFQASNLKQVAADKTYELWVIPVSGKPIPAGLFRPDETGTAMVLLPELPKGIAAKAFGVTVEQAAGSQTPTAPIVLSGVAPVVGGE